MPLGMDVPVPTHLRAGTDGLKGQFTIDVGPGHRGPGGHPAGPIAVSDLNRHVNGTFSLPMRGTDRRPDAAGPAGQLLRAEQLWVVKRFGPLIEHEVEDLFDGSVNDDAPGDS